MFVAGYHRGPAAFNWCQYQSLQSKSHQGSSRIPLSRQIFGKPAHAPPLVLPRPPCESFPACRAWASSYSTASRTQVRRMHVAGGHGLGLHRVSDDVIGRRRVAPGFARFRRQARIPAICSGIERPAGGKVRWAGANAVPVRGVDACLRVAGCPRRSGRSLPRRSPPRASACRWHGLQSVHRAEEKRQARATEPAARV